LSLPPFERYEGPAIKNRGPRFADARRLIVDDCDDASTVYGEVEDLASPDGATHGLLNGENLVKE
jgi:hypothetical protein